MKSKWRGIKTSQVPKNEDEPITIYNRYKQKSVTLSRIDDGKRWAGFPGITGISRKLAKIIPKCNHYVEPFAGTAKVFQSLEKKNYKIAILNDKAPFIHKWLLREFETKAIITNFDFTECIKRNNQEDTFFLIDQPWNKSYYDQPFSFFDRTSVKEYDIEVLNLCSTIKGKFIITTRKENKRMLDSSFYNYTIKSEYPVSGKLPEVLLTTNFKIDRRKLR